MIWVILTFVHSSISINTNLRSKGPTLFRSKRFALNEMFLQNVSRFAIFYVKPIHKYFFFFAFRTTLFFSLFLIRLIFCLFYFKNMVMKNMLTFEYKLDLLWGIGNQKIRFYDDSAVAVLHHHHLPGLFINSYALIDWLIFSAKTVLKKTGWYFQQKTVKNLPKF